MIGVSYSAPKLNRTFTGHITRPGIDENHWVDKEGKRYAIGDMRFSHLLYTVLFLRSMVPALRLEEDSLAVLNNRPAIPRTVEPISSLEADFYLASKVRCYGAMMRRLRLAGCNLDQLQRPPKYMAVNEVDGRPISRVRRKVPKAERHYRPDKPDRKAQALARAIAVSLFMENGGAIDDDRWTIDDEVRP